MATEGRTSSRAPCFRPPRPAKRHVHHQHRGAHRQGRQKQVEDLGDAGEAAHGDVVGLEETVEGQRRRPRS